MITSRNGTVNTYNSSVIGNQFLKTKYWLHRPVAGA